MTDKFKCSECGREFDSKRGLSVHNSQMHKEEESSSTDHDESNDNNEQTLNLSLGLKSVAFLAFVFGVVVGGASIGLLTDNFQSLEDPAQSQQDEQLDLANAELEDLPDEVPIAESSVDVSKISTERSPIQGDTEAPVTLVMYEDYQCAFCQQFETQILPNIKSEYVDSGDLKIVWKDYPIPDLGHDWTMDAHRINRCVYEQDEEAFWSVKNHIFQNANSIDTSNVEETVIGFAQDEGVSESDIRSCLENGNSEQHIQNDKSEAEVFETMVGGSSFVSGTPSFVVYSEGSDTGTALVGAMPFEIFQLVIEDSL